MSEFDVITRYFDRPTRYTNLGVGDDAALLRVSAGMSLAVSADMLVSGTHFFPDTDAFKLGWKSLAVNISDMAAMGAMPKWATLALALPQRNDEWLEAFSQGFFACADAFSVDLIGGDTTQGALTIAIQIMGEIPLNQELKRNSACAGDDIWVSGTLGQAALGLAHLQNKVVLEDQQLLSCLNALYTPQPRVDLGLAIRNVAHSAIDISDGLLAELGHITKASNVGATVQLYDVPCASFMKTKIDTPLYQQCILAGGDDYELCFTAPQQARQKIQEIGTNLQIDLTIIGQITTTSDIKIYDGKNRTMQFTRYGYDHFA